MISLFWDALKTLPGSPCRLLECGARRQPGQGPGAGADAALYRADVQRVGLDREPGEGVDVVADLHDLSRLPGGFHDAVLCCSTLEHVRRPWVVARELTRVTRPGGVLYCATHQTFPMHSNYGGDYFRFSADALAEVFGEDAGWHVISRGHEFPCLVVPLTNQFAHSARDWNFEAETSYLNSWCLARRA